MVLLRKQYPKNTKQSDSPCRALKAIEMPVVHNLRLDMVFPALAHEWLLHFEVVSNFHNLRVPHTISHFYLFWKVTNTDQTGSTWQVAETEKPLTTVEDLPALQLSSTSIMLCYTPVPSFTPCCILLGIWIYDFQAVLKTLWSRRVYLSQHRVQEMQALK